MSTFSGRYNKNGSFHYLTLLFAMCSLCLTSGEAVKALSVTVLEVSSVPLSSRQFFIDRLFVGGIPGNKLYYRGSDHSYRFSCYLVKLG